MGSNYQGVHHTNPRYRASFLLFQTSTRFWSVKLKRGEFNENYFPAKILMQNISICPYQNKLYHVPFSHLTHDHSSFQPQLLFSLLPCLPSSWQKPQYYLQPYLSSWSMHSCVSAFCMSILPLFWLVGFCCSYLPSFCHCCAKGMTIDAFEARMLEY